ncbi:RtcB family protein [Paenibacillus alvei]|uniref:RtcB family protein n=1 Tax=Paenibacillus alvei TaxID=44250 RepID=UPI0022804BAF|nr:RtcB family protein [Paenibacillus alvei]MCY9737495.1 RtcB family protein [Paenibacillus alvei]
MIEVQGKFSTAKIFTDNVEQSALSQIYELLNQKAFEGAKIRIMPDVHSGKGCVIGFTANLGEKVIPNLVGVDIGCGLHIVELGNIDIDFASLDTFIRNKIPHGHGINGEPHKDVKAITQGLKKIAEKTDTSYEKHMRAIGSLGGGNHFIEINADDDGNKYLVIHSGSRNLGLQVAKYHQKKAEMHCKDMTKKLRDEMNRLVGKLRGSGKTTTISSLIAQHTGKIEEYQVPKDLMFLEGKDAEEYLEDMIIAQLFARLNRERMAELIVESMGLKYRELESWTTIHNYIDTEDAIIRKGAISAKEGEKVIIPLNMRDGSIIAMGKSNNDWNNSAPHGAGRVFSRSKAKEKLSLDEFESTMQDVWTSSIGAGTIDEAPMAYKPSQEIIDAIHETVDIVKVIKPLYNFKSS